MLSDAGAFKELIKMTDTNNPLFTPVKVGTMVLKNRFVVSPMASVYCDREGMSTERFIAYHETKARGGWGMIIIEDVTVDTMGGGFGTAGLYRDEHIPSHAEIDVNGLQIERDHEKISIAADTVVLALGMKADTSLAQELTDKAPLEIVGDAVTARNALEAVREGFLAGAKA